MFLIKRIILLSIFMIQTSFGVSIVLDGTRTVVSGSDCSTATYRFGTTTSYNGDNLDILLNVVSEDNDYTGGACVNTQDGVVSFHIKDNDASENVASMDLKFTVVKKGTTTPVAVDMLTVTNFDLDNSPGATQTDDVYYTNPLQTLISNDSDVLVQTSSFYNQYTVKLRGKNTGNCNDSATLTELSCRAGAIWKNTSSIFARVQNDDAYGRYSIYSYPTAHRLLQFSFEYEDIAPLINDNNETKDCGVYNYSLNGSQWIEGNSHSQYNSNLNIQKTISIPNASQLKISFSGETEDSYDYLYIIDEDGNQHSYDGNLNNENDLIIDGSLVTLKFTSDNWVEEEGVTVTVESLGCNEAYDFGDAPNQYTHVSHKISPDLYLGNSAPDEEDEQQSTTNATGDGADDSDGVTNLPTLKIGDSSYTVPVKVFNNTGNTAYITAWIDFNRNGTFEYEEALNTNNLQIPSSSSSQMVNVQWSNSFQNQLANISMGKAIMRIRLTTSRILRCDDPHYKDNGNYQDNYLVSPDGEVEDYEISIEAPQPDVVKPCSTIYYSTSTDKWVEGTNPVEYNNNLDISKIIEMNGTDSLRITVNGEIEHGNGHNYDWIYVYDEEGNEVYKDDGNLDNTPFIVQGNKVTIKLHSDGGATEIGATIKIEGTSCSQSNNTATCYALTDDSDRLYKVIMSPNANPLPVASYVNINQRFNGEGSAYRASNNKFYAFTGVSDDEGPSDLYSIDVKTGAITPVKDNLINESQGSVEGAEFYFIPTLNKEILYVISQEENSKLYAFDPDNNWALLAGYPKNTHTNLSSLAINPVNGIAYAIDDYNYDDNEPKVYKLNLATGVTTHITTLQNLADAEGLAFASDGNLYIEDEGRDDLDGKKLYMVNLQTGELTPSAITNSNGDIEGLSCNGTQLAINNPTVSLDGNHSVLEGDSNTTDLVFPITLSKPAVDDILLHYEITDINTTANEDYILETNLTILIPKDANSSSIVVKVKGDIDVENNETFSLKLVDATNAILDSSIVVGTIINDDEDTTPQLIANYHFDECSWNGTVEEVKDSIGSIHGKAHNNLTTDGDGKIQRTGDFDKSEQHYIDFGNNFNPNSDKFSISVWFKSNTTNGEQIIYNKESLYETAVKDGYFQYAFRPHWHWDGGTSFPVEPNTWYHAVITYDGKKQRMYRNGVEVYSRNQTENIGSNNYKLLVGARNSNTPRNFFDGDIDEFKIFNSTLSDENVQTIYNNENSGKNWDGTEREAVVCEVPQEPFVCSDTLYLSNRSAIGTGNNDSGSTWLHRIDRDVLPYAYVPIGEGYVSSDGGYNAIGYNVKNNFIYALYKHNLLKIDKNGVVKNLGEVQGLIGGQLYTGEFDRDGNYYVGIYGGGGSNLYKIDVNSVAVVDTIPLKNEDGSSVTNIKFWDMAIDETGDYFYMMIIEENNNDANEEFAKLNISTGVITRIGEKHSDLLSGIGLTFSDKSGKVYMMEGENGFYKVDTQSGNLQELSSTLPLTFYNDGTSCPDANISEPPGLSISSQVKEKEGDNGTTDFTFTVSVNRSHTNPMLNIPTMGFMFNIESGTASVEDDDFSAEAEVNGAFFQMGNMVPIFPTTEEVTITVKVKGDTKIEADETFFVNIVSPQFIGIVNGRGVGVIVNDDSPRFNVERTGLSSTPSKNQEEQDAKESFYTQIAGRDFDYTIVSYDKNSSGFKEFNVHDMMMRIELIDNNSTVDNEVIYRFYTYLDENASRFDITDQDIHQLELNASRNVQFKLSYLEQNSSILHGEFTPEQFESNQFKVISIRARDNFAIRPAGFIEELHAYEDDYNNFVHISTDDERVEVASGYPYELNITALDFNHQKSYRYNTSVQKHQTGEPRDVRFQEVNATLVFDDDMRCENTENVELKNYYDFRNGKKSDTAFKHKNVGKYRVEVKDNNWTNIDHYYTTEAKRGCVVGKSFISLNSNEMSGCNIDSNISFNGKYYHHMELSFEPYSFDLSNLRLNNLASPTHPDYLYMGDLEQSKKMAIQIAGEVIAKAKDGETTTNFTKDCHAKEVILSLKYNGTSQQGDFNNTTFVQLKTVKDTNVTSQRTVKYNDGSVPLTEEERLKNASNMTLDANITIMPSRFIEENKGASGIEILYTIQKNLSEKINPVEIAFNTMKAEAKDAHSIVAWKSHSYGVKDKNETLVPKGTMDLNSTKLFYFSRIVPDKIDYAYTLSSVISTPISIEIYCDVNQTWCSEKKVNQGNGINSTNSADSWYRAIKHDSHYDGKVTIAQLGATNEFNTVLNTVTTNIEQLGGFQRGKEEKLESKYQGNTSEIPVKEPIKAEMTITPDPWLKYYSIPDRHGNPYYHLIFMSVPPGSHTGIGQTGNILNIKANSNVNRKMDW